MSKLTVALLAVLAGAVVAAPSDVLQGVPGDLPPVAMGEGLSIDQGIIAFDGTHTGTLLISAQAGSDALIVDHGVNDWSQVRVDLPLRELNVNGGQLDDFNAPCASDEVILSGSCACTGGVRSSYPTSINAWHCKCGGVDGGCDGSNPGACNNATILCLKGGQ